jgi:DNA mismatch endonuclease, patch repair protein
MDMVSKRTRSAIMSRIRSRNTGVERLFAMALVRRRIRHEKWADMFGRPDFVFRKKRFAVFVDGCFWHMHEAHFRFPKSNKQFWREKLRRNMERDAEVNSHFQARGWNVVRFWECDVRRDVDRCVDELCAKLI